MSTCPHAEHARTAPSLPRSKWLGPASLSQMTAVRFLRTGWPPGSMFPAEAVQVVNRPNWRQLRLHRIFHQGTPKPAGVHGGPRWNPLRPTRNRSLNILSWHLHVCQATLEDFGSRMTLSRPVCLCWGVSYCTPHSHASCGQKPLNHFMYPRVALLAHGKAARQVTDQGESMFAYRSAGLCAAFPRWPATRTRTSCGDVGMGRDSWGNQASVLQQLH